MRKLELAIIISLAVGWLAGATSAWTISGAVTVTPPDATKGVVITADQTTPTKAPLHLAPQDTAPSSCAVGDLAVVVTELQVCTAANTWTVVGSQS